MAKSMVTLTFYGGVNEIGGNKILVEHKGTRLMLDFGMSFTQAGKYFAEFLKPRKSVALKDFFEMGLLPDIPGVYREDYLNHMGRPKEERGIDALFLSHAHADHAEYIHFLRKDIPIYCSPETKIILGAIQETGVGTFSDFVTICNAFMFYKNTKGSISKVTRRNKEHIFERPFSTMESGKRIEIGSFQIEMFPVDHSLPGCCGLIIYTDEGSIVYTGDIRFHGYKGDSSKIFVEEATKAKPKWLISEGTRIDEQEIDSEKDVFEGMSKLVSQAKGLVFVEHPIRDLDRVFTIYQAAHKNTRELVVTLKQAYFIKVLEGMCPLKIEQLRILIPQKEWGLMHKTGAEWEEIKQNFSPLKEFEEWEAEFVQMTNSITYEELKKNPSQYVVSMNLWEIANLIDIH